MAEIIDGTSTTVAFSERIAHVDVTRIITGGWGVADASSNPGLCAAAAPGGVYLTKPDQFDEARWNDGRVMYAGFYTVLAPNSPSCTDQGGNIHDSPWVLNTASSLHPGGVLTGMCDGSVRFTANSVDTGNLSAGYPTSGPSPYGVWGAMGSRSGGEAVNLP